MVSADSFASTAGNVNVAGDEASADSPVSSAGPGPSVSLFTLGNSRCLGSSVLSNPATVGDSGARVKDSFAPAAVVSSAGPSSSSSLADGGPSYESGPTGGRPGFPSNGSVGSSLFNLSSNSGQGSTLL